MIIEYTRIFDRNFAELPTEIQLKSRQSIETFIDCYVSHRFPKSLRVHKCGSFLSLSVSIRHRVFVLPIKGGIRFAFIGDHEDADNFLKRF
ncbi:MAG: hypothetical protein A3C47_07305 [Omnitrophica bacterium RIFCSPHIGHO2_02_FULL_51_18]|nr:MAG: hypothetical protein A3C47_07305 [Omnitrophica bacterium RIFCSPHIGHO2_02_FULL_51_18]